MEASQDLARIVILVHRYRIAQRRVPCPRGCRQSIDGCRSNGRMSASDHRGVAGRDDYRFSRMIQGTEPDTAFEQCQFSLVAMGYHIESRAGDVQAGIGCLDGKGIAGNNLNVQLTLGQLDSVGDFPSVRPFSSLRLDGEGGLGVAIHHDTMHPAEEDFLGLVAGRYRLIQVQRLAALIGHQFGESGWRFGTRSNAGDSLVRATISQCQPADADSDQDAGSGSHAADAVNDRPSALQAFGGLACVYSARCLGPGFFHGSGRPKLRLGYAFSLTDLAPKFFIGVAQRTEHVAAARAPTEVMNHPFALLGRQALRLDYVPQEQFDRQALFGLPIFLKHGIDREYAPLST